MTPGTSLGVKRRQEFGGGLKQQLRKQKQQINTTVHPSQIPGILARGQAVISTDSSQAGIMFLA